jgi:aspartate/methionine/tyrosine aminotransferase
MTVASRMLNLGTETAFEVLAKARALEAQGKEIVHLEIGEPDFDTPRHIVEAGIEALRQGYTHYGPTPGLPELREAIARNSREVRGISTDPSQVVVTPGAKPIMFYVILALAEPGVEVIYPNPGFPIYESMIRFSGATPVPMRLLEEKAYHPDLADLPRKITPRTRLIILNSPENPCGSVLTRDELHNIAHLLREWPGIYVLSDEIYKDILYTGQHHSIASFPGMAERTIILDGFSKSYAMTGWRLGYGILPEELVPHIVKLAVNSVSCAASFSQRAAIAALDGPQDPVHDMVAEFARRRRLITDGLRSIPGIDCPEAEGAFYVFPSIKGTGLSSG